MAEKMKSATRIIAVEFKKFDGIANQTTYEEIRKQLFTGGRIDLIPQERIVKLNIRWAEQYCVCTEQQWKELYEILNKEEIVIKKKTILGFFCDILDYIFIQPLEILKSIIRKNK